MILQYPRRGTFMPFLKLVWPWRVFRQAQDEMDTCAYPIHWVANLPAVLTLLGIIVHGGIDLKNEEP